MKAIILAAGYGRRMRPLTDNTHKTLLPIAGRPIINRIIDVLIECGITDVVVVTGYLHDEMVQHLDENYPNITISYIYNKKYAETNNIFSLALAFEEITIDSDILLIESDLIFHPSVLKRLLNNRHENVALVDRYAPGMDGTVVTVESGTITNIIPPHLQQEGFDFSDKFKTLNIYKFSQEFAATTFKKLLTYYARVIDDNCYYELILGILIFMQREVIHAEILEGEKWAEVDDPNDMQLASFVFDRNEQYKTLSYAFGGYWNYDIVDFCFIRNMYFPTGAVLSELKNNMEPLLHNYGSRQEILNKKLSYVLLCNKNYLQLLNGASQVYPILSEIFADKTFLLPNPTFGEYTRSFEKVEFYNDDGDIDLSDIVKTSLDSDAIVFVNPNNPTGTIISTRWIFDFSKKNPKKIVIVDESFIEFSEQPSIIDLLEKDSLTNIIVIKSLSKSWGIPGLRLGYCYTQNSDYLNYIKQHTPIWNMNSMAEFFIEIILKHRKDLEKSFEKTAIDRENFVESLASLDFVDHIYKSGANFILVRLKGGKELAEKITKELLLVQNIFVKNISDKFEDVHGYLRLAVRLPIENMELTAALKKFEYTLIADQV